MCFLKKSFFKNFDEILLLYEISLSVISGDEVSARFGECPLIIWFIAIRQKTLLYYDDN